MRGLPLIERILFSFDIVATSLLLLRLLFSGLHRVYALFTAFVVLNLIDDLGIACLPFNTNIYARFYMGLGTLLTVFDALIVLELYSLVFRDLPGIATIARRYIKVAIGLSIFISLLLLGSEQVAPDLLSGYQVFHRAITTSLVLFVVFVTAFLFYYPIPLARNVIVCTLGYAIYFLAHAVSFFIIDTSWGKAWKPLVNLILQFFAMASIACWAVFLNREGEVRIRTAAPPLNSEHQALVLDKLQSLNSSLLRTAKK